MQEDGVNVAFKVVDGDEWEALGEGKGFGVSNADQERSSKAGTAGDCNGIDVGEGDVGLGHGCAHDGDDGAEMFAAGQFGGDPAKARVGGDLRGHNRRKSPRAALDDSGGGLVARKFDAEDQTVGHDSLLYRYRMFAFQTNYP